MAIQDILYSALSNHRNPFNDAQNLKFITETYNIQYLETTPEYILIDTGLIFDNVAILDNLKTNIRIAVWDNATSDWIWEPLSPKLGTIGGGQSINPNDIWFFDDERYRGTCFIHTKWVSDTAAVYPNKIEINTWIRGNTIEANLVNWIIEQCKDKGMIGDYKYSAYTKDHSVWFICDGRQLNKLDYQELYTVIGDSFNLPTDTDTEMFRLPDANKYRYLAAPDITANYEKPVNHTHTTKMAAIAFAHNPHSHTTTLYFDGSGSRQGTQSNGVYNSFNYTSSTVTTTPNMNALAFNQIYKNAAAFAGKSAFNFEWSNETLPSTVIANMFIKVK